MRCPLIKIREAIIRRFLITARIFVPANRIRTRFCRLEESRQIVMVVLIADRANKLPIQRKMLELWNIGIPPLGIARNRHPVPIIFVAKFIIDQAITKDTIHILDHTRIISEYIRIAYASQHDERDSTNTFDSLNSLYFDIIG